jgi:hypothetical protein
VNALHRCPGIASEGCDALLAPGRDRCNLCRRDRERLNPEPTKGPTMPDPVNDRDPAALRTRADELEAVRAAEDPQALRDKADAIEAHGAATAKKAAAAKRDVVELIESDPNLFHKAFDAGDPQLMRAVELASGKETP